MVLYLNPIINRIFHILIKHYEDILEHYGHERGVRIGRKHIGWYSKGLPGSANLRAKVNSIDEARLVKSVLSEFYTPLIDGSNS